MGPSLAHRQLWLTGRGRDYNRPIRSTPQGLGVSGKESWEADHDKKLSYMAVNYKNKCQLYNNFIRGILISE